MTIETMLIAGFLAGLLVGAVFASFKAGCGTVLLIPVAMILYVGIWQSQNPDAIRSTSALDYVFVPLWPSLGAVVGFVAIRVARKIFRRK